MKKLLFLLAFSCATLTTGFSQDCDLTQLDVSKLSNGKNLVCTSSLGTTVYAIVRNGKIKDYEMYGADGKKLEFETIREAPSEAGSTPSARQRADICYKCRDTATGSRECFTITCP